MLYSVDKKKVQGYKKHHETPKKQHELCSKDEEPHANTDFTQQIKYNK